MKKLSKEGNSRYGAFKLLGFYSEFVEQFEQPEEEVEWKRVPKKNLS